MVAVQVRLGADGQCDSVAIGLGGVAPAAVRAAEAERIMLGERPTPALLDTAADAIGRAAQPEDDLHATAEDRRHLARVLGRRALAQAVARASAFAEVSA
jgi:carbon-monoxide dehydrogenase medium subunit